MLLEGGMEDVSIGLTKDEALVLFEFLSRFSSQDVLEIQDQAEERALWNLACSLEKVLAEPFSERWVEIISEARERLRDDE
jgi:hypothetical protein